MKITAFNRETLLDYPGKIACEVFTSGCNYKCPSCHAKRVVNGNENILSEEILKYIKERKAWIDGVVICGGEPTMQADLPYFLKDLKKEGVSIKLDTNGRNFAMLGKIFEEKLADYVAMDVKGPFNLYRRLTGVERVDERDDLLKGMSIVNKFPGYEYRTTMVPLADDAGIRWLSAEEIGETAKMIYDHTGVNEHIHYIQPFVARSRDEMLDERFCKENLPQEFHETPRNLLEEALKQAQKYLPDARLR